MSYNKKIATLILGAAVFIGGGVHAETTGQFIDDATLTGKVKAALIADKNLHAADISVNTDAGVVKLTGQVDTDNQYALAGQDANHITGVKAVANMLTVRNTESQ